MPEFSIIGKPVALIDSAAAVSAPNFSTSKQCRIDSSGFDSYDCITADCKES